MAFKENNHLLARLAVIGLLGYSVAAHAQVTTNAVPDDTGVSALGNDADANWRQKMWTFNGFGTLGLTHSNNDQADYTPNLQGQNGAGHTDRWSPNTNSKLGAQVTANFTPQLQGVLQIVSQESAKGNYDPQVEWLNLRYEFLPGWSARVGRTLLTSNLDSASRKVGYTLPWVRTPLEVYDFFSVLSGLDGADLTWQHSFGDFTNTANARFGIGHNHVSTFRGASGGDRTFFADDLLQSGPWTAHVSYLRTHLASNSLDSLTNALRLFGPQGNAIANEYDPNDKILTVSSASLKYDPGRWFVQAEFARQRSTSLLGDRNGWYIGGGYRMGAWTPYVIYARQRLLESGIAPQLNTAGLPPALAGFAAGLNSGVRSLEAGKSISNTISMGVRWDAMRNTDIKLQYDRVSAGGHSIGPFSNAQDGVVTGRKADLITLVVDFVF